MRNCLMLQKFGSLLLCPGSASILFRKVFVRSRQDPGRTEKVFSNRACQAYFSDPAEVDHSATSLRFSV